MHKANLVSNGVARRPGSSKTNRSNYTRPNSALRRRSIFPSCQKRRKCRQGKTRRGRTELGPAYTLAGDFDPFAVACPFWAFSSQAADSDTTDGRTPTIQLALRKQTTLALLQAIASDGSDYHTWTTTKSGYSIERHKCLVV